jgi:hypothetical protein
MSVASCTHCYSLVTQASSKSLAGLWSDRLENVSYQWLRNNPYIPRDNCPKVHRPLETTFKGKHHDPTDTLVSLSVMGPRGRSYEQAPVSDMQEEVYNCAKLSPVFAQKLANNNRTLEVVFHRARSSQRWHDADRKHATYSVIAT